jgi:alkylation response protein AidB-like acyl-CoA dehydrogenase
MDFDLDRDQQALQATTRSFCADRFPMAVVRAAAGGLDRERWRELAGLGVFDPDDGGLGLIDIVLVFEELGRALVPGPLVASALAAPVVDGAAQGDSLVSLIERDGAGATIVMDHYGSVAVGDGARTDVVLVLDDDGIHRVAPDALDPTPVTNPLDPTTPLARLPDLPAGERIAGPEVAATWRRTGSLLTAALLVGIAGATTDIAVAYAQDRQQFGRPIGSFQAIKHLLADMYARAEVTRASVYAAGVTAGDPDAAVAAVGRAVAGARVLAGRAALDNARSCIQVHGGVGFTWEADPHLYLKRALLHDTRFGSVDDDADTVAHLV